MQAGLLRATSAQESSNSLTRSSDSQRVHEKLNHISQHLEDVSDHEGHSRCVYGIAFSPDGQMVLTGSADKTAKLWNYHTRHVLFTFTGHEQWVQGVAFAHSGKMICTGSDDNYVRIWEHDKDAASPAEGWTMIAELGRIHDDVHAHTLSALSVAFDPNDDFVCSGSADTSVKLWRVGDKECAHDMLGHLDWVTKVAYSPDGNVLASSSYDETVKLWRVSDGDEILTIEGHDNFVTCVAWHPDGDKIVTSSGDYTVRVWLIKQPDGTIVTQPKPLRTMYGHNGWALSCTYSPMADRIASSSADKTVILWDPVTFQAVDRLFLSDWVEDCAYVPRQYSGEYLSDELLTAGHFIDAVAWDVSSDAAKRKGELSRRSGSLVLTAYWLMHKAEKIVLGGPKALAVDEVAFLKELWDDLDRDAIDDSVWLQEFMELIPRNRKLARLLSRRVYDEVQSNVPYPRTVKTALEHHRNTGASRLSKEELFVALEGMRNWQTDNYGNEADKKVSRRQRGGRRGQRRRPSASDKGKGGESSGLSSESGDDKAATSGGEMSGAEADLSESDKRSDPVNRARGRRWKGRGLKSGASGDDTGGSSDEASAAPAKDGAQG